MAYEILCDVAACKAVIDRSDAGQPTLGGKQHVYCPTCTGYIAAVDQEMDRIRNTRSWDLINELNKLRDEKIAAALPQQQGGTGLKSEWTVVVPEARP